ncbi:pyridoxal phosphate-dependent aminotransferase family protein [soil metagenome]
MVIVDVNQSFNNYLQQKLEERKVADLFRELVCANEAVDFCSNDYLGFSQLPALKNIQQNNLPTGATGSRLISGNSQLAEETEKLIADFHNAETALIFNSGYDANLGFFSCISSKNDSFISDEYIHASIIDGLRLGKAARLKFRHNNTEDLEKKLQQATGNKFVVVESIYSMNGDEAPLETIAALCKKYQALLIVDEAHATGVYGEKGEGLVSHYHLEKEVYARIITFGKALGLHGAAILGSNVLRNYLINHARSFIYTTALPPHSYLQIQKAYTLLPSAHLKTLMDLVDYFRTTAKNNISQYFTESFSPIQGIIVGDNEKAGLLSAHLFCKGFFVKAIRSPTVPPGTERLRICLHTFNTTQQIDEMLSAVKEFLHV